jgi:hypothetical protein
MAKALYMIVESYRDADPVPIYRRFRERGRLTPEGLRYVDSWVSTDQKRCFQLMECEDPQLLEQWMANWQDLVQFEVIPVITSAQAVEAIAQKI